ncbi:MAG: hypothetical protein ACJ79H_19120 [Myxococcales bacterium]
MYCVEDDDRSRRCEDCKQEVVWEAWRSAEGTDGGIEVRDGHCGCAGKGYLQTRQQAYGVDKDVEELRADWHAAEDAYDEAIRQGRSPIEIEALLHRKQRLKAAYLAKKLRPSR